MKYLVPANVISMRKATYEAITGQTLVDSTLAVRGEPGSIPRLRDTAKPERLIDADGELGLGENVVTGTNRSRQKVAEDRRIGQDA